MPKRCQKCKHSHIQILHQDSASISCLYFCSTYTEYMYDCMTTSSISCFRQIHLLQRKTGLMGSEGAISKMEASKFLSAIAPMSVILASRTYYFIDYGPHLTFKPCK